ncbi:hypothetical protein HDU76_013910 [Blyttiomyces sp. JEL0837]|nr:hypothetical protein HDU76_013910 [Blyttiomyces sp. JEL0837]
MGSRILKSSLKNTYFSMLGVDPNTTQLNFTMDRLVLLCTVIAPLLKSKKINRLSTLRDLFRVVWSTSKNKRQLKREWKLLHAVDRVPPPNSKALARELQNAEMDQAITAAFEELDEVDQNAEMDEAITLAFEELADEIQNAEMDDAITLALEELDREAT